MVCKNHRIWLVTPKGIQANLCDLIQAGVLYDPIWSQPHFLCLIEAVNVPLLLFWAVGNFGTGPAFRFLQQASNYLSAFTVSIK